MAELAAKYRDRARERRDGGVPGTAVEGDAQAAESDATRCQYFKTFSSLTLRANKVVIVLN